MISTHLYLYKDVLIEIDIYLSKRKKKNLNTSSLLICQIIQTWWKQNIFKMQ